MYKNWGCGDPRSLSRKIPPFSCEKFFDVPQVELNHIVIVPVKFIFDSVDH